MPSSRWPCGRRCPANKRHPPPAVPGLRCRENLAALVGGGLWATRRPRQYYSDQYIDHDVELYCDGCDNTFAAETGANDD